MKRFQGVYPALVTPVDDRGNIRTGALRDLMEWHLEVGVDGFYIAGGTGEGLLLTQDQRKELTEATVSGPPTEGFPSSSTWDTFPPASAVDLACHASAAGADAVSAIPPIYYGTDPASTVGHYAAIASATPLPLIVLPHSRGHPFPDDGGPDDRTAPAAHGQGDQVQRLQPLPDAADRPARTGPAGLFRE